MQLIKGVSSLPERSGPFNVFSLNRYLGAGTEHPGDCSCGKCQSYQEILGKALKSLKPGQVRKLVLGDHVLTLRG